MNGIIEFNTLEEMAEFVKNLTGCTASFNGYKRGAKWVIEFTGGF